MEYVVDRSVRLSTVFGLYGGSGIFPAVGTRGTIKGRIRCKVPLLDDGARAKATWDNFEKHSVSSPACGHAHSLRVATGRLGHIFHTLPRKFTVLNKFLSQRKAEIKSPKKLFLFFFPVSLAPW